MKPVLAIKQASELTGLSVPTIYRYVLLRTIPHVKISTRVLFDEDSLAKYIDEHRREPAKAST